MSISLKKARLHNSRVIADVSAAILENLVVDPYQFLKYPDFASEVIMDYIEAANLVRPMMGLPKLFLYDLKALEKNEEDED